jgi:hypothetical protein
VGVALWSCCSQVLLDSGVKGALELMVLEGCLSLELVALWSFWSLELVVLLSF